MIHGGPRARDYWDWDSEAQYFAALGYTVLKINYRGSSEYGLEYSPYSHLDAIRNSIVDVADGVRWAIDEGFTKSGKAAIYGSSFGGHVALRTAAEYPELFSCVIGYAGVYDWVKEMDREFAKEPIYWKLKQFKYYGDYDNEKEQWWDASAVTLAGQIRAPVYLLHGGADEIVASRQSRLMHKALKNAGKDVTLKILSFNNHGMVSERPTIRFYENLAKFVGSAL
jgi:dipeptidyl aminopeptidase/acylaminoacyl peptidase